MGEWRSHTVTVAGKHVGVVLTSTSGDKEFIVNVPPERARTLGRSLLTAADHADENRTHRF